VQVQRVLKDSPAARAGLEPGDRVLRIGTRAISGLKEARAALAEVQPGDPVAFVVRRGSGSDAREQKLTLTAGEGL
jgi:S1-C subfamily serine protease